MSKLKILTIANRKGGAGKSTCAAHIAFEAAKCNYKTILIDLDPQKTLEQWWKKREDENPYLTDVVPAELKEVIKQIEKKGFDLCIIDTPGDKSVPAQVGIEVADLVLIPSKATAPDLGAIGRTITMVTEKNKEYAFIVTQTIPRSISALKAVSILSGFGTVAPSTLTNKIAYSNAMGEGSSAATVDKVCEEELAAVWQFLESKLFNTVKEKVNGSKAKVQLIS